MRRHGVSRSAAAAAGLLLTLAALAGCATGARALQADFREVAARVVPSVVRIDVVELRDPGDEGSGDIPFYDFFFGDPDGQAPSQPRRQESLGSGIIIRQDGDRVFVVTNAHVVADSRDISITLDDGRTFPALPVGRDERKDIALVEFAANGERFPVAALGDSDRLRPGDWVLAVGTPYGFQSSVSAGIVSAVHRRGGPANNINDFIQTDAAINKGNSGGALVDIDGRVVGINTWITSQSGDSVGLGFAIPANNIAGAIDDFVAYGRVRYGWFGIAVGDLDAEQAASLGGAPVKGALVTGVYRDSPAARAGLRPGDVVVALGGRPIPGGDELIQRAGDRSAGERVILRIWRSGAYAELTVETEERLADDALAARTPGLWPGAALYPLDRRVREELGIAEQATGLIVRQVIADSPAQRAGLKLRDIVMSVDGTPVTDLAGLYAALGDGSSEPVTLSISRDGKDIDIELYIKE